MISYSRKDIKFAKNLFDALLVSAARRDLWIDWESIPPSDDWLDEIRKGIELSDVFVFVLSPDSIANDACNWEVDHALKCGKRIVPVVCRDVDYREVRKEIASLNWIFFRPDSDDFDAALKLFTKAIDVDSRHVRIHTKILRRAIDWHQHDHQSNLLLRTDVDLTLARHYFAKAVCGEGPFLSNLHYAFLTASDSGRFTDAEKRAALTSLTSNDSKIPTFFSESKTSGAPSIFISYLPIDRTAAKAICTALGSTYKLNVDWEDNANPNTEWLDNMRDTIEQSAFFIAFMSPESISSNACNWQIDHAVLCGKPIIPVVLKEVDYRDVRKEIAAINWVFARTTDEGSEAGKMLLKAIEEDARHALAHNAVLSRAMKWGRSIRGTGTSRTFDAKLLMPLSELPAARTLMTACSYGKEPGLTMLMLAYIRVSDKYLGSSEKAGVISALDLPPQRTVMWTEQKQSQTSSTKSDTSASPSSSSAAASSSVSISLSTSPPDDKTATSSTAPPPTYDKASS